MLDEFALACAKQSPKMLDNLGIRIDLRTLPSWELYVYARDRKYGRWWGERWWFKHIRPWLRPGRQAAVDAIWEDAKMHQRHDFMNALLDHK